MISLHSFQARVSAKFAVLLTSVMIVMGTNTATIAHEVRTSQEVGGTIHIEPNDRPVAGKKSTIWIALTKRGGEIIPYEKCNCRMEVRSLIDKNIKFEVSNSLSIIERYLGLPGLEVTFPQVGRYELKLSGSPKGDENFQPFELIFTTNVGK
jgi:hypothetical protein